MNVADLFVRLGIKGGEESAKEVNKTSTAIEKMKKMSIETKIAITGAFYALQRMATGSMNAGMEIDKFARLTGMSTKSIQQLTFAGDQFGVTASEMQGHLSALQKAGSELDLTGGGMQGLTQMSMDLKRLTGETVDIGKMKKDMEYALGVQGRFSRLNLSDSYKNNILGKTGASDNIIQALKGDAFNKKTLDKAPVLSQGEIKKLAAAQRKLNEVMANLDKMVQQFVADVAPVLVEVLKQLLPSIKDLANAVRNLILWLKEKGYFQGVVDAFAKKDVDKNASKPVKFMTDVNAFAGAALGIGSIFGKKTLPQILNSVPIGQRVIEQPMDRAVEMFKRQKKVEAMEERDPAFRAMKSINNIINNNFDIKSSDPKEAGKEVNKQVSSAMNQLTDKLVGA